MSALDELADALDARCTDGLNLVLVDGVPASGKSTLSRALEARLAARGRAAVTVENDWFIARSIRSPVSVVLGLALALSPASIARVERRLLRRFLDGERLRAFQDELQRAARALDDEDEVTLFPRGAFWNLRRPRAWEREDAARGLRLPRGGVVLVEGTLTAAAYRARFPGSHGVFVRVPVEVARARFLDRNRDPSRERNLAFSALAMNRTAFRLAARMLERAPEQYDFEIDLADLERPVLSTRR